MVPAHPRERSRLSFLKCPNCRLTVAEGPYYFLRGDLCPRCRVTMVPTSAGKEQSPTQVDDPSPEEARPGPHAGD